ncbi:helix-turn-helix transcriptional regulator [Agathobaculum sp.]|uniref:helix-turn-helix transcriptional regulator n=1 Tax=Agathobaculum sp. TaxID=2048138 RepID=UPI002A81B6C1|nr:WYL domain-containing protein [Agathobaculum sp.]MDY3617955.1 WYL domain-containing protein [Agathobaculum sp.]
MAKNSNQKLKLLYLYRIFLEKTDEEHKLTMSQILSSLSHYGIEAERKSIYDDIAALQDYGLDIALQRGRNGGYYIASRDFELPELKLLVDAVQCSRFITEKKSNELIKKVEALASEPQARALQRQVYISGRVKTMNESIYYNIDKLHTAISSGKKITFRYFEWAVDFSGTERICKRFRRDGGKYTVSPWALTWDDENYYLVAYNGESDQIRHYRVDKMEHIALSAQQREGQKHFREQFNVAAYTRKMFGMFSGEERTVRLRCENRFIGVIRDRFGSDLMLQKLDEEHFAVNVTVAVSPQFFSWIFGLGGAVRILEPDDVRSSFQKQLQHMTE